MAYDRNQPLLVIVEEGLKAEGLLEPGADWYVYNLDPVPTALTTPEFNGLIDDWRKKVLAPKAPATVPIDPSKLTIGQLVFGMKPGHLVAVVGTVAAMVVGAYTLGTAQVWPKGEVVRPTATGTQNLPSQQRLRHVEHKLG